VTNYRTLLNQLDVRFHCNSRYQNDSFQYLVFDRHTMVIPAAIYPHVATVLLDTCHQFLSPQPP
jgi:hypothetical protein